MRETRAAAREEGVSVTFPFKATDVAAIHSSFHKHGDGIYFRLKDGRVFSAFGIELDPNPARYADVPSPRFFPCMPVPRPRRST
jgi:hypothetical protein